MLIEDATQLDKNTEPLAGKPINVIISTILRRFVRAFAYIITGKFLGMNETFIETIENRYFYLQRGDLRIVSLLKQKRVDKKGKVWSLLTKASTFLALRSE